MPSMGQLLIGFTATSPKDFFLRKIPYFIKNIFILKNKIKLREMNKAKFFFKLSLTLSFLENQIDSASKRNVKERKKKKKKKFQINLFDHQKAAKRKNLPPNIFHYETITNN
jgi:hypothetical protein